MAEMPKEGLIKIAAPERVNVKPSDKAALVRKGNQLFNAGDIEMAKKVFLSLGYTDGIVRVGDHHYQNSDYLEAYRMYRIAPAPDKASQMTALMAKIVMEWMEE